MAEGGGFEPPEVSLNGFQDRHNRPLCQPSNRRLLLKVAEMSNPNCSEFSVSIKPSLGFLAITTTQTTPARIAPRLNMTRLGSMRIMDIDGDLLVERTLPTPTPGPGQVLIDVAGAGLNRADLLQMKGLHPPPPGAPTWPGLEVAGVITEVGDDVDRSLVGTHAMALIDGGGYA